MTVEKFHIDASTAALVEQVAEDAATCTTSVNDVAFQRRAAVLAHELPRDLREALVEFRLYEPSGALLLSGIEVDDDRIGPTPEHWCPTTDAVSPTLREEIIFSLLAQLLGDPFGYATLHNGLLVHNIIPIRAYQNEQIAFGSAKELDWHTEEAFHPHRSAYTSLMCLRNPNDAPTTYYDVADLEIGERDRAVLRRPSFATRPSGSHSAERNEFEALVPVAEQERAARSFAEIEQLHTTPAVQPVLFGDDDSPYICVDPDCMTALDEEADAALQRLIAEVNRKIQDVALAPGDVLFIDNFRAIHGRKPFAARFDGNDRWLKRMNVARDLRPSRRRRLTPAGRIIY